jgi:type I restriction enzyme S subunit
MSRYKPYPAYRDSGVEWIGRVPEHWETLRIKRAAALRNERRNDLPNGWTYVGLEDVEPESGRYAPTKGESRLSDDSMVGVFCAGDVLYGKLRPYLRKAIVAERDGVCSTEFLVLIAGRAAATWLHCWLLTPDVTQQIEAGCDGAKMPRADWEHVGSIPMPLPPPAEQSAIAAALDRETTRIDALIAKKTRFIELLKEKRSALITHAVTKGLDPNAKMKDSGVEWIGEVPEHWVVCRFKYIAQAIIGLTYSPDDVVNDESGTLVLRSSNIQNGELDLADTVRVTRGIPNHLYVHTGDILVCSRNGSRALIGKNIQIDSRTVGATFGAFMTVIRSLLNDFLYFVFNSSMFDAQAGLYMTSTVNQLTVSMIDNMEVVIPPEYELAKLVETLRIKVAHIDLLTTKTQHSIDLLKERRSAFITAAVTGQIDLREVA